MYPNVSSLTPSPSAMKARTSHVCDPSPGPLSAGFTIVDVLAMGAAGHGLGVGIVLGLKGIGAL